MEKMPILARSGYAVALVLGEKGLLEKDHLDIFFFGQIKDVPSALMEGSDVDLPNVQVCVAVKSRARVWFNTLFCEILPVPLEALLLFLGHILVWVGCAGSENVQGSFGDGNKGGVRVCCACRLASVSGSAVLFPPRAS